MLRRVDRHEKKRKNVAKGNFGTYWSSKWNVTKRWLNHNVCLHGWIDEGFQFVQGKTQTAHLKKCHLYNHKCQRKICCRPFLIPATLSRDRSKCLIITLAAFQFKKIHRSIRCHTQGPGCTRKGRDKISLYIRLVTSADVTRLTAPASATPTQRRRGGIKSAAAASTHLEARISKSPLRLARGRRGGGRVYGSSAPDPRGHGEGGATPSYRRRRREEGGACRGARAGAAEAELVVAGHRARRGVGAPAPGHAPRRHGVAARPERHRRRPRRAPRVHRSGVRLRAGPRRLRLRVRGVRLRREEPPPGDAARARPLLRRPRRSGRCGGIDVLVRCRVGGLLRRVAARQPHVHTLSRRPAGDGEDAAEAVGAGGCAVHAQPPLSSRRRRRP